MNGSAITSNGDDHSSAHQADTSYTNAQILRALELIYDPRSSNEHRQDASRYLEQLKAQDQAPHHGYVLAANKSHPPVVRHYGLSLLEDAIRHRWASYTGKQSLALREWVVKLAQDVAQEDPAFIRNKVAQLWVEIATRSWVLDWIDMDELLVMLWAGSVCQKELVLEVLETLSDNSFGKEDTTTALRGSELGKACVEIFTPAQVMIDHFPKRDTSINVRFGGEGWLFRISALLHWYSQEGQNNIELQTCGVKALTTVKSVVHWIILRAIATTNCIQGIFECLTMSNPAMQLVAVEALCTLYNRSSFSEDDVRDLVWPLFKHETVNTLKILYQWSVVDANDIDEEKYRLCKKLSEMIHNVGQFLDTKLDVIPQEADLPNFLDLLLRFAHNESLHVSIAVLHLWIQLLDSDSIGDSPPVMSMIGPLLEVCSQRLIRYEYVPEDTNVPAILLLKEDIDTIPERHAFLGNYARFCKDIVNCIVQKQPLDAIIHILDQTEVVLNRLYDGEPALSAQTYSKYSIPALKLDAQFSVVEASLLGYSRWRAVRRAKKDNAMTAITGPLNHKIQQWCSRLLELRFEVSDPQIERHCTYSFQDPTILQRVVSLVVEFVGSTLKGNGEFVIRVFHFVFDMMTGLKDIQEQPDAFMYNEAVIECRRSCAQQLQRLALREVDQLMIAYGDVEATVGRYCQSTNVDQQERDRCISVLFVIVQRAGNIDQQKREAHLEEFIAHVIQMWQDPALSTSLSSFAGFCDLLGLSKLQSYFVTRKVNQIEDWAASPLDDEGQALKLQMEAARDNLPLRATKTFLGISVERSEPGTLPYQIANTLWSKYLPIILPNLLQLISLAHSFSDPASWSELPSELRGIPARVLRDRYWQVGISLGSREDFYSQIGETKLTMEGLASTIRSSLRMVRETSYRLLYSMSLLGNTFYDYQGLAEPLSRAVFGNASLLTIHQTGMVLTGIPPIIYSCPPHARAHFVPPLLIAMFEFLDQKVSTEWSEIEQRKAASGPDDDLVVEMENEAILRQLTNTCVSFVVRLLEPDAPTSAPSLRSFILATPHALTPLILFCTHALRMHDSRACGLIARLLRSLLPAFADSTADAAPVREFLASDVLKACIESLHDPYFVDVQSDLALLIAGILATYAKQTPTPRLILLSLPGMTVQGVDATLGKLREHGDSKRRGAVVLKLLEGLRGVSVSEMGKRPRATRARGELEKRYVQGSVEGLKGQRDRSPDLGGVADMFA
ncbi:hypothetical protein MMC26_005094 [Xylographa opegraphella]|nr:hypothetical protein [Xylographa opegraphella]